MLLCSTQDKSMFRMAAALTIGIALTQSAAASVIAPLVLEETIALPDTAGRIDHLDIDLERKRLFVVELGNGSVDVVDLSSRKVTKRITGLDEPQGVVYAPRSDVLAIACGGDGTVRLYSGGGFAPHGVVKLGGDADNARLDPRTGNIVVGYGRGGLAVIDPVKATVVKTITLPAHPEAFQLSDGRAFVNVPDANMIAVADLGSGKLIAKWPSDMSSNFPMALGGDNIVAVAFRSPAKLALFDSSNGRMIAAADTCGDADDVFFDATRKRFMVSCGEGAVDVFGLSSGALKPLGQVSTVWGARTSLFVPQIDRLFLAVRAGLLFGSDASIQIYRPVP
jgi:YVTN family beta-propeller protein